MGLRERGGGGGENSPISPPLDPRLQLRASTFANRLKQEWVILPTMERKLRF